MTSCYPERFIPNTDLPARLGGVVAGRAGGKAVAQLARLADNPYHPNPKAPCKPAS